MKRCTHYRTYFCSLLVLLSTYFPTQHAATLTEASQSSTVQSYSHTKLVKTTIGSIICLSFSVMIYLSYRLYNTKKKIRNTDDLEGQLDKANQTITDLQNQLAGNNAPTDKNQEIDNIKEQLSKANQTITDLQNQFVASNTFSLDERKKIEKELEKHGFSNIKLPEKKNHPILITKTGCFRLPHWKHIEGSIIVYRILVGVGYTNVRIIISPSHQHWVDSKCSRDEQNQAEKGDSYKVRPDHETRVKLVDALVDELAEKGEITDKERSHIEVSKTLEKEDQSDWPVVMRNLSNKMSGTLVIYCSGADLIRNDASRLIKNHIAFKRTLGSSVSSTEIINDQGNYRAYLKNHYPKYYALLKITFPDLNFT